MSQTPFPIALLCAKTASGDIFGRAIPLWTLLRTETVLKTREQMAFALRGAEAALGAKGGLEGFAIQCLDRQIMMAQLDDVHADESAARAALSRVGERMLPGPIAKLGSGSLDEPLRLAALEGFSAHLAEIDRLGPLLPVLPHSATAIEQEKKDRQIAARREREQRDEERAAAAKLRRRRLLDGPPDCAPIVLIGVASNYSCPGMSSMAPMYCEMTIAAPLSAIMRMSWADRMPKNVEQADRLLADFQAAMLTLAEKSAAQGCSIKPIDRQLARMEPIGQRWALSVELEGDYFHSDHPAAAMAKKLAPLLALLGPDARLIEAPPSSWGMRGGQQTLDKLIEADPGLVSMIDAADMKLSIKPAPSGGRTTL